MKKIVLFFVALIAIAVASFGGNVSPTLTTQDVVQPVSNIIMPVTFVPCITQMAAVGINTVAFVASSVSSQKSDFTQKEKAGNSIDKIVGFNLLKQNSTMEVLQTGQKDVAAINSIGTKDGTALLSYVVKDQKITGNSFSEFVKNTSGENYSSDMLNVNPITV